MNENQNEMTGDGLDDVVSNLLKNPETAAFSNLTYRVQQRIFALARQGLQLREKTLAEAQADSQSDAGEKMFMSKQISTLTAELAASEAKVERIKAIVNEPHPISYGANLDKIKDILFEPPFTSLDLYHKERNKKELGEVIGAVENISNFYVDKDGLTGGRAVELAQKALSILKRLTE